MDKIKNMEKNTSFKEYNTTQTVSYREEFLRKENYDLKLQVIDLLEWKNKHKEIINKLEKIKEIIK